MDETQSNTENVQTNSTLLVTRPRSILVYLILLVIAILIALIIGLSVYYINNQPAPASSPVSTSETQNQDFIAINDPKIIDHGKYLTFKSKILDIIKTSSQIKLIVELSNGDSQEIFVSDKSLPYYLKPDGRVLFTDQNNIQVGQDVNLTLTFSDKTQNWTLRTVMILVDEFPKSTPAPSEKNI